MKKPLFANELELAMLRGLSFNKEASYDLGTAVDYIHNAIELFEDVGMDKSSDKLLNFLNKLSNEENETILKLPKTNILNQDINEASLEIFDDSDDKNFEDE